MLEIKKCCSLFYSFQIGNELWKHFQDKELMRVFDYLFAVFLCVSKKHMVV